MTHYTIAMILSFVTACFTFAASWTKVPKRTYWFQVGQCLVYSVAAYFFGVYSCVIMMLISAVRNGLAATDRYKAKYCLVFSGLALGLGLLFNTSGLTGLMSVAATVQYCICSYIFKNDIAVKVNVAVNLGIWMCYDFLVRDYFSGTMDSIGTLLALVAVVRICMDHHRKREVEREVL